MLDRNRIIARIQALLAKTTSNGCTEEEALSAAQKAAELLEKYDLTLDDLNVREERITVETFNYAHHALWRVSRAISILTGCRYWTSGNRFDHAKVSFAGIYHKVKISHYLMDICERAVTEKEKVLRSNLALLTPSAQRRKIIPYIDGIIDRLAERIIEMKPKATSGTALVVCDRMVDDELNRRGIKLREERSRHSRDLDETYAFGILAGDRVSLNEGLETGGSGARIAH